MVAVTARLPRGPAKRTNDNLEAYRWLARQALLLTLILELFLARWQNEVAFAVAAVAVLAIASRFALSRKRQGDLRADVDSASDAAPTRAVPLSLAAPHHGWGSEDATALQQQLASADDYDRALQGTMRKGKQASLGAQIARRLLVAAVALEVFLKLLDRNLLLPLLHFLLRFAAALATGAACTRWVWPHHDALYSLVLCGASAVRAVVQLPLGLATEVPPLRCFDVSAAAEGAATASVRAAAASLPRIRSISGAVLAAAGIAKKTFGAAGSTALISCSRCGCQAAAKALLIAIVACVAVASTASCLLGAAACLVVLALSALGASSVKADPEERGRTLVEAPRRKRSASPPPAAPAAQAASEPRRTIRAVEGGSQFSLQLLAWLEAAFTLAVTMSARASVDVLEKRGVQCRFVFATKAKAATA